MHSYIIVPLLLIIINFKFILSQNSTIDFSNSQQSLKVRTKRQSQSLSIYQHQFPNNYPFFCDLRYGARSSIVPNSVHRLTPGDIDIVAAIGDSLTVGYGAGATNLFECLNRYQGMSFCMGGRDTWQRILTLPNILKLYNPNLYGYSTNEGFFPNSEAKFNVAAPGALSSDSLWQAQILLNQMKNDPNVDMNNHWKLITYMIGSVDFCQTICDSRHQNSILSSAAYDLITTLRFIKTNFPRTLVNVVLPPNPVSIVSIPNLPMHCTMFHSLICPCASNPSTRVQSLNIFRLWKMQMETIVKMAEFHDSNEYEVNLHPFLDETIIPKHPNGKTIMSYMSADCFHFSQKGHSMLAIGLWNSMLTPENQRIRFLESKNDEFKCPTVYNPYLATIRNS